MSLEIWSLEIWVCSLAWFFFLAVLMLMTREDFRYMTVSRWLLHWGTALAFANALAAPLTLHQPLRVGPHFTEWIGAEQWWWALGVPAAIAAWFALDESWDAFFEPPLADESIGPNSPDSYSRVRLAAPAGAALGCALACWLAGGVAWKSCVASAVGLTIGTFLGLVLYTGAIWAFGKRGLGGGDVFFLGMACAWLGIEAWGFVLLGGTLLCFPLLLPDGFDPELPEAEKGASPMIPALAMASVVVAIAWHPWCERIAIHFVDKSHLGAVAVMAPVAVFSGARVMRGIGLINHPPK